jgi:photosystem II stability/assembly factor-like uncharacterized protein
MCILRRRPRSIGHLEHTIWHVIYIAALSSTWRLNEERDVFRTTDGGQTWSKVLYKSDKAEAVELAMDVNKPRVLYAAIWET